MTPDNTLAFRPLKGLHEPSAILQLPDGRFLVVEDEPKHPFSLFRIGLDDQVSSAPLSTEIQGSNKALRKLDDLEGLTADRHGNIYAITSHSRNADGKQKKSRDRLVRFRIESDRIIDPIVVTGLKPALLEAHPILHAAAKIRDVKDDDGINIEALEISADQQNLLIGFRSPLLDNRALIATVENHAAMFEADEAIRISNALITLNLEGDGIRGMSWLPALNTYLLISGPSSGGQVQFKLWRWSGQPDEPALRLSVPGLLGLEHAEGVCPAVIDGQPKIIFVSDDGSKKQDRFAHFLLLDPAQLDLDP
ncbi:MAG: DUF3616 domain-containing protein [Thiobacillus sp.]|nr:DUF3616 domain-containing protein [Thiobacillus sp.]